jgi:ABC-type sugar transport system ATPase subunit
LLGIDLDLAPGEVLGVAGLAGSGRGHLLQAILGAVPRSGQVLLAGAPLPDRPQGAWAAGIAYVPRERRAEGLMLHRPIVETATLPHLAALFGRVLRPRAERRFLAERGTRVRLKAAGPQVAAHALSGGNQQKLLFARAIGNNPRVLLLDDPTRGVDVGARADLYRLIRDLADAGTAVLLVSSDLPELIGLSDRIAILQGGRIVRTLAAAGLTEADLLARTYEAAA